MKKEEIRHIAEISKLYFTDEELDGIVKDFSDTMDLIDKIKESKIQCDPTFHTNKLPNRLRDDEVRPSLDRDDATRNADSVKYGYFEIIKFVE
ncbi:MAG: Asp-tRNA(Asn)/Glu-tRNA(Gln) amidotransferase subunit GatC [Peptoniphilus sp.]|nr:Asp-tRNA(Asn)/Glu-tRNA(Gln) amidotransferase subunit GatC [Peptoniphilus sp.]MDD7363109.1 Asp-tRNA(Asn)/Glu-tRNA(Gln) amidotransferase subunit GatC [Bacillota bacterium]MDY6044369.1 Asp-tRNA(Asn)/Glu-tRNA(Gln) amidotransferase subunit GatC [Peptoniphilus sp.]